MEVNARALQCYSRLRTILADRKMTVAQLNRNLAKRHVRINFKTLYRLSDPTVPIQRLDTIIAAHICEVLGVDLSHLLTFEQVRREMGMRRLVAPKQRILDRLLERSASSKLNAAERKNLNRLVDEAERLTLKNMRMLARARQR